MDDLRDALIAVEKELGIKPPFGAQDLPPPSRFRQVLIELKRIVCPHAKEIQERLKGETASLVTVVSDTLISSLAAIPIPVTTISKHIAAIGIENFCSDPARLFELSRDR